MYAEKKQRASGRDCGRGRSRGSGDTCTKIADVLKKKQGRPAKHISDIAVDYTEQESRFLIMLDKWKQSNRVKYPTAVQMGRIWDKSKEV